MISGNSTAGATDYALTHTQMYTYLKLSHQLPQLFPSISRSEFFLHQFFTQMYTQTNLAPPVLNEM